jgi:TP901 family phage tail tape measure protein
MASTLNKDEIQLSITVKAADAQKELLTLQKEAQKLAEEFVKAGKGSEELTKDERYRAIIQKSNELYDALKKNNSDLLKDSKVTSDASIQIIWQKFGEESASIRELEKLRRHARAKAQGTGEKDDMFEENMMNLAKVEARLAKMRDEMAQVKKEMKLDGSIFKDAAVIGSASLNQLTNSAEALDAKLKRLPPDTLEFIQTSQQLALVKDRMDEINKATEPTKDSLLDFKQILNTAIGVNAFDAVKQGIDAAVDAVVDYGKALSELEAITNVSGDGLKDLASRADELTSITIGSGQVITNTSTDMLKAFKLVGSAKPELLGNAEALQAMTKEAIVFAQASGMELPKSVEVLSTVLDQFSADASETTRYMNAMAAGAKEGTVEIEDTSDAIQKFGAVSKTANITIEESVALVQTLSKTFKTGEETGTALKTMLLKIQAPEMLSKDAVASLAKYHVNLEKIKDTTIPLSERLKELKPLANDLGALKAVFEEANVPAASKLLNSVDNFTNLTKAVTGTNEAYRQAAVMSNNLGNDIDNLKDSAKGLFGQIAKSGEPIMRQITQAFTGFLKSVKANWDTIVGYSQAILIAVTSVSAYYGTVKLIPIVLDLWAKRQVVLTAVTTAYNYIVDILTGKITLATVAQQAFNLVTKLNPIGLVISAVTAAVGVWAMYSQSVSEAVMSQKMINDLNATASKNIASQKIELEQLLTVARDDKRSKEDRLEAVKKLNELSHQYLGNLTLEKINTDEATKAADKYVSSLEKRAKSEAAFQKRTELEKDLIDLKSGQTDMTASFGQQTLNYIKSGGNAMVAEANNAMTYVENYKEKLGDTEKRIESLNKYISSNQIEMVNTAEKISQVDKKAIQDKDEHKKKIEMLSGSVGFLRQQYSELGKQLEATPITQQEKLLKLLNEQKVASEALAKAEAILFKLREESLPQTLVLLNEQYQQLNKLIDATPLTKQAQLQDLFTKQLEVIRKINDEEEKRNALQKEAFGRTSEVTEIKRINVLDVEKKRVGNKTVNTDGKAKEIKSTTEAPSKDDELAEKLARFQVDNKIHNADYKKELRKKDLEDQRQYLEAGIELARTAANTIFQIANQRYEREKNVSLKALDKEYKAKMDAAKNNTKLKSKLEKEYEAKKELIEKEAFERNKRMSIAQAILNGALAATAVFVVPDFTFGIKTAIQLGLIAANTIAQIAVINSQKFAKGGITQGASHSDGGIKMVDSKTGGIVGEMEGGEPYMILSDNTYRNNKAVIDALLNSSINEGGKKIYADGGVFSGSVTTPNFNRDILRGASPTVNIDLQMLINKMDELTQAVKEEKTRPAELSFQHLEDTQDLVSTIRRRAANK